MSHGSPALPDREKRSTELAHAALTARILDSKLRAGFALHGAGAGASAAARPTHPVAPRQHRLHPVARVGQGERRRRRGGDELMAVIEQHGLRRL